MDTLINASRSVSSSDLVSYKAWAALKKEGKKIHLQWNNKYIWQVHRRYSSCLIYYEVCISPAVRAVTVSNTKPSKSLSGCLPQASTGVTSLIQVIDADMSEVIKIYQDNTHITFSHCISGDFKSKRQISRGVAATLSMFGWINISDV